MSGNIDSVITDSRVPMFKSVPRKKVTASIKGADGKEIFSKEVTAPETWSDRAVAIVAQKYLTETETSVYQMVNRVAKEITNQGVTRGYFSAEAAPVFQENLVNIAIQQLAAFNSPVWFNVGCKMKRNPGESFKLDGTGDDGTHPQASACFIQSIDDSISDIMKVAEKEAVIFKYGSGSGINISTIRSSKEKLSNGGMPSGPLSFMRIHDQVASVVKSGGRARRAAQMRIMNVDHPDILDFIRIKSEQDKMIKTLMEAGLSGGMNGEASQAAGLQNANLSVRVPDEFMKAYENDKDWMLTGVKDKDLRIKVQAKQLMNELAKSAWECGDPGIQFHTTINKWNTCPSKFVINGSNPCQPGFATVLTPDGIRTFDDIDIGSTIWSGNGWCRVVNKNNTGTKDVYKYRTTSGVFVGTGNHRVVSNGEKVEADSAVSIDSSVGECLPAHTNGSDVIDGFLFGDGSVHQASNNKIYAIIGADDDDVIEELKDYLPKRNGISEHSRSYDVVTTLSSYDLPRTYKRSVPDRFFYGDRDKKCGFLRGLFSANGSVCGGRVTLKTSSAAARDQVKIMLSSVGIHCYHTTNKSKDVLFSNGAYTCRESYDINITFDKHKFLELIGFIQKYKVQKVLSARTGGQKKRSFDVSSKSYLGKYSVYDITVDAPEHTYWTGGLLVSNCGEFVWADNSACNLASVNLLAVHKHHDEDPDLIKKVVNNMVIAQNILMDFSTYPSTEIASNTNQYRPIGLGIANLGGLLMETGLPYDSERGRDKAASLTSILTAQAYICSAEIGKVFGRYPASTTNEDVNDLTEVLHMHRKSAPKGTKVLWDTAIKNAGYIRNAQVSLVAPAGTISFLMDCATTGVEPEQSLSMKVKDLCDGGSINMSSTCFVNGLKGLGYSDAKIGDIVKHISSGNPLSLAPHLSDEDKRVFYCAMPVVEGDHYLPPKAHIDMMAAIQPLVSGAISKTIIMPYNASIDDVKQVIVDSWESGLKSITIYRDGSKPFQPLNVGGKKNKVVSTKDGRRRLPNTRESVTHKFDVGGHEGYLTVGMYEDGKPGEMFVTMSKEGSTIGGLIGVCFTAVSLCLQHGVKPIALINKFKHTRFEPSGFTGNPDIPQCTSVIDYIFQWLEKRFTNGERKEREASRPSHTVCSQCGSIMQAAGTCNVCPNCGDSAGACGEYVRPPSRSIDSPQTSIDCRYILGEVE